MSGPIRIQRRRTKGYRLPPGAIYVGRPSRWGNDYKAGECLLSWWESCADHTDHTEATAADAAAAFRLYRLEAMPWWYDLAPLRGHDLACWCPLTDAAGQPVPCHADVLLVEANR